MGIEKPLKLSSLEKKAAREREERETGILHERARAVVEKVDFNALKGILTEERQKAGVPNPEAFECASERVRFQYLWGSAGAYDKEEKTVVLDPKVITEMQVDEHLEFIPPEKLNFENEVFSTLVHEETHAASKNGGIAISAPAALTALLLSFAKPIRLDRSGYSSMFRAEKGKGKGSHFEMFNEAVTDRIAGEVWKEYRRRTGNTASEEESYRSNYFPVVSLLDTYIGHVAQKTDVAPDEIWKGIKQGYFTGLDLSGSEMREQFEAFALTELMGKLERIKPQEVPSIINDMAVEALPEESIPSMERSLHFMDKATEKRLANESLPDSERIKQRANRSVINQIRARLGLSAKDS